MQLPRFRAESPCCSRHAAPCSRRLLPVVQRTQHALGTARAVEMRHNCAGAPVNTSTETTRAVRACIGVRDLCVEAGAFGPNVQNVSRSEARVFQRGTAVEHGMPPSLTNMSGAQLHRPSTSWLTARTCLPGSACWAGQVRGQAFLGSSAVTYQLLRPHLGAAPNTIHAHNKPRGTIWRRGLSCAGNCCPLGWNCRQITHGEAERAHDFCTTHHYCDRLQARLLW